MTTPTTTFAASRRQIWMHFLLYPGHTLPTAAAPVLVAAGLAIHDGVFAPVPLLLVFVGSWLIHVAGVLADNHELLRRHRQVAEHPELLAALAAGTLTLGALRLAIGGCLLSAALLGIYPVMLGGLPALLLGALGVLASLGYACGPWRYAKQGLADPLFLLMFGVAAVAGTYYVQAAATHAVAWSALPRACYGLGLPVGCLVTCVLVIDDIRDRTFDAEKGWRTTAVRFGLAGSRALWIALSATAYLLLLWFWLGLGFGWPVLLPWLTLPVAVTIARAVLRFETTRDLFAMTPRTSMLAMVFAALLGFGIAL